MATTTMGTHRTSNKSIYWIIGAVILVALIVFAMRKNSDRVTEPVLPSVNEQNVVAPPPSDATSPTDTGTGMGTGTGTGTDTGSGTGQ